MSESETPAAPSSGRERLRRRAREERAAKRARRDTILELVVSGCDHAMIAKGMKLSMTTVRREVDKAIDQRQLDTPARYVRMQVERLTKALRAIDLHIDRGDLTAVDPLVKVVNALDRYHAFAYSNSFVAEPTRLAHAKPLALVHAAPPAEPVKAISQIDAEKIT